MRSPKTSDPGVWEAWLGLEVYFGLFYLTLKFFYISRMSIKIGRGSLCLAHQQALIFCFLCLGLIKHMQLVFAFQLDLLTVHPIPSPNVSLCQTPSPKPSSPKLPRSEVWEISLCISQTFQFWSSGDLYLGRKRHTGALDYKIALGKALHAHNE